MNGISDRRRLSSLPCGGGPIQFARRRPRSVDRGGVCERRAAAAPVRAAGSAHRRPDRRGRHLCRLLRLRRPGARDRRALPLRLRAAVRRLGRGASTASAGCATCGPPTRRSRGPMPARSSPNSSPASAATGASPARPQVLARRADLVPQPVAAHPRQAPTMPSTSASCGRSGRGVRDLERSCAAMPAAAARLFALIALGYAGLCCEGSRRSGGRPTSWRGSSTARSCPTAAMRAAILALMVELLLDLLPLRQIYASRGVEPPQALVRAIDRMLPMLRLLRHGRRHPRPFQRHGRIRRMDHLATLLIYDDARNRPMPRARIPATSGSRQAARWWSPMSARPAGPPIRPRPCAGCLSFELSSGPQRIVVNCGVPQRGRAGAPGGALDRRPFDRRRRRGLVLPLPRPATARARAPARAWLFRRLGAGRPARPAVVPVERDEGTPQRQP